MSFAVSNLLEPHTKVTLDYSLLSIIIVQLIINQVPK